MSVKVKKSSGKLSTFDGEYAIRHITGILVTKDGQLIISGDNNILLLHPDRNKKEKIHFVEYYVPSMTWVSDDTFAFIDMGKWFSSDVCSAQIKKNRIIQTGKFSTDHNCIAVTFLDEHFILGFVRGIVKIVNRYGIVKTNIDINNLRPNASYTYFNGLKMSVDQDYKLYVITQRKAEIILLQLKKENFKGDFYVYKQLESLVLDIAPITGDLMLATMHPSTLATIHKSSFSMEACCSFLHTPHVLCYHGNELLVSMKKGWFKKETINVYEIEVGPQKF